MKRRDFLQKGTLVAGLASSQTLLAPLLAGENKTPKPAPAKPQGTAAPKEVRTGEYLKRAKVQKNPWLNCTRHSASRALASVCPG